MLDVTCDPDLYAVEFAEGGPLVTGIDFRPASIEYARQLTENRGVLDQCAFIQEDVRVIDFPAAAQGQGFDATLSVERCRIIDLERGEVNEILLCDQTCSMPDMIARLSDAGFQAVDSYPAWDGLPLYDSDECTVNLATA